MRSPKFQRQDFTTCTWGLRLREALRPQAICAERMLLSGQLNGVSTSKFDPFRSSIPSPWSPSRPGEFHPEPLTEPYVNLSIYTARATAGRLPLPVQRWGSSRCQMASVGALRLQ
jgi:hypothetical protein